MSQDYEISHRGGAVSATQETDLTLVELIRQGDSKAFDRLFLRHYTVLCRLSARIVRDMDIAEDIVQGVFFRLWVGKSDLGIDTSVRAFLERSVRNASLDHLRHMRFIDPDHDLANDPNTGDFIVEIENRAALKIVEEAISALPEGSRTIFLLSRVDGFTYQQISVKLGVSIKTVETQMGRALKAIRNSIPEFSEAHR
jgi:RNA polymerase sigma-70 factor (ECF subfamily)